MIGSIVEPGKGLLNDTTAVILLAMSTFLVASGGNILNDLGDVSIDRKAHPGRPLPSGLLTEKDARGLLAASWTLAIIMASAASMVLKALLPIIIVLGAIGLLVLYEKALKKKGAAGNLCIGILTGAPFLLGASAGTISIMIVAIFLMASLSNISREIMKDIEDMDLDRAHRSTIPIRFGKRTATTASSVMMFLGVAASFLAIPFIGPDILYLSGIAVADLVLIISIIGSWKDPRTGQRIAKLGMAAALVIFITWGLL